MPSFSRPLLRSCRFWCYAMLSPASDSQDNADPGENSAEINVPTREMLFIRDNLVAAESARRRGDTSAVYKAYNRCEHVSRSLPSSKALIHLLWVSPRSPRNSRRL